MQAKSLLFWIVFAFTLNVQAQDLNEKIEETFQTHLKSALKAQNRGNEMCDPDSFVVYKYNTPTDSLVVEKIIYKKYSADTKAKYYYYPDGITGILILDKIDSIILDNQGREVYWDQINANDLGVFRVERRILSYPHGTTNTLDSMVTLEEDFFTETLLPYEKTTYDYDASDRLKNQVILRWDNGWGNRTRLNYNYDSEGKISLKRNYTAVGTAWTLLSNTNYTYTPNNALTQTLETDAATNEPLTKTGYTYNEVENTTTTVSFKWNADLTQWVQEDKYIVDLDDQDRLSSTERFIYFINFTVGLRAEFKYTPDSDCPLVLRRFISENTPFFNFISNGYYYYGDDVSTSDPDPLKSWTVAPNPSDGYLEINAPLGSQIQIVDINGRVVYEAVSTGKTSIDLPKSIRGMLLMSVRQGNQVTSRPLMIE
jgi:Secretion system C-terminal sorting domain